MANTIKVRQSAVAGKVPTTAQLALGELAINTTDGKLFLKKSVGGTESIIDVTGSAAGVSSFNTRSGAVTLSSADVTGALNYTPVNKAGDTMTGRLVVDGDAVETRAPAGGTGLWGRGRSGDNLWQMGFRTNGDTGWMGLLQFTNGNMIWNTGDNGTNLTESFRMNTSGYQILPIQPYCYVGLNASVINSSSVILFDWIQANRGGCYNSANGRFTAPVGGIYEINVTISRLGTLNSGCRADGRVTVNGGVVAGFADVNDSGTNSSVTCSFFYPLASGDYVQVYGAGFSINKPFTGHPEFYTMSIRLMG